MPAKKEKRNDLIKIETNDEGVEECTVSMRELMKKGVRSEDLAMFFETLYETADMPFADEYWAFEVKMPSILNNASSKDDMIVCCNAKREMTGCAFINNGDEKIIYKYYIFDEYDGIHVASVLTKKAVELLKTNTPIVRIKPEDEKFFKRVANEYGWDMQRPSVRGFYNDNAAMEIFNQKK